ncbi:MAG: DUF962 domain-containing protein [Hahellaceae bacterium]|jgi:uncharacterized membrane protein YGL010W|nr:DUF962 domain-containing protein [Hahellaceae bacterium]
MKNLNQHLSQYAAYHRDKRNIATHFVGIPMIVFAVIILLSRPAFDLFGLPMTPALIVTMLTTVFYLKLDMRFGIAMGIILLAGLVGAKPIALMSTAGWLTWGVGLFVVGWIIQFIGHYYEGKKPAFVDDLVGLVIGPLFVLAEFGFMLGLRKEVETAIVKSAGPTLIKDKSLPASGL